MNNEAATTPSPIRYGVLPNAANDIPLEDIAHSGVVAETVSDITTLDDYDALVGYGAYDGWQTVPNTHSTIALRINTSLAPLNSPAVADVARGAMNGITVTATLNINGVNPLHVPATSLTDPTQLANVGYPNGITLYAVWDNVAGVDIVRSQLASVGVRLLPLSGDDAEQRAHLFIGRGDETADNTIPLYTLPISYRVREGLTTSFTDDGWPIVSR